MKLPLPPLIKAVLDHVGRIFDTLDRGQWPAKILLLWGFLLLFSFYPFGLSVAISQILKQYLFVAGGIMALTYLIGYLLFKPLAMRSPGLIYCLLAIAIVTTASTFFSADLANAIAGQNFEVDTAGTIFSFVVLVVVAQLALSRMKLDLMMILGYTIGLGLILPVAGLNLLNQSNFLQNLYISNPSLCVLAGVSLILATVYLNTTSLRVGGQLLFIFILGCSWLLVTLLMPISLLVSLFLTITLLCFGSLGHSAKGRIVLPVLVLISLIWPTLPLLTEQPTVPAISESGQVVSAELTYKALRKTFQRDFDSYLLGGGPHSFSSWFDRWRNFTSNVGSAWGPHYQLPYVYSLPAYSFGLLPTYIINTGLLGLIVWAWFTVLVIWRGVSNLSITSKSTSNGASPVALVAIFLCLASWLVVFEVYLLVVFAIVVGVLFKDSLNKLNFTSPSQNASGFTPWTVATLNKVSPAGDSSASKNAGFGPRKAPGFYPGDSEAGVFTWFYQLPNLIRLALFSGALILLALAMYYLGQSLNNSLIFQKGVDYWLIEENHQRAIPILQPLVAKSNSAQLDRVLAQVHLYQAQNLLRSENDLTTDKITEVTEHLSSALKQANQATKIGPQDYRNWMVLGTTQSLLYVLGATTTYNLAVDSFTQAQNKSPVHPLSAFEKMLLAEVSGDNERAKQLLQDVLDRKPDFKEDPLFQESSQSAQE